MGLASKVTAGGGGAGAPPAGGLGGPSAPPAPGGPAQGQSGQQPASAPPSASANQPYANQPYPQLGAASAASSQPFGQGYQQQPQQPQVQGYYPSVHQPQPSHPGMAQPGFPLQGMPQQSMPQQSSYPQQSYPQNPVQYPQQQQYAQQQQQPQYPQQQYQQSNYYGQQPQQGYPATAASAAYQGGYPPVGAPGQQGGPRPGGPPGQQPYGAPPQQGQQQFGGPPQGQQGGFPGQQGQPRPGQQQGQQGGYGAPPQQGGYPGQQQQPGQGQHGQQGGYGAPPQQGGYGGAPQGQQGGYGAPHGQQGGYGAPQGQQGGYGAPTGQQGGYGAPQQQHGGANANFQGVSGLMGGPGSAGSVMPLVQQKLQKMVQTNRLEAFYPPQALQRVFARLDCVKFAELSKQWNMPLELATDLAQLALYDIVIYADDSGSMVFEERGERIDDLKLILGRVAEVATLFDDDGILVRFMNNNVEGNGIRDANSAQQLISQVQFNGMTPLGTALESKVIRPFLVSGLQKRDLQKPILCIVISDGEPVGEPHGTVKRVIQQAKQAAAQSQYGPGAISFEFAQVGKDQKAQRFLGELDNDAEIGNVVDATSYYELEAEEYARKGVTLTPELWLVKLMVGAIDPSYDEQDE